MDVFTFISGWPAYWDPPEPALGTDLQAYIHPDPQKRVGPLSLKRDLQDATLQIPNTQY